MSLPLFVVDAFTEKPFLGNPAAVVLLTKPGETAWMQDVAREMNLAETAFLHPQTDSYSLRWFTPTVEVDLCGHATLGSAFVLWHAGKLRPDQQARFQTRSGLLTADKRGEWIEMDFPAKRQEPATPPAGLAEALGVKPMYVGTNRMDYLVEVESEAILRGMRPDFQKLAGVKSRGTIVTCRSEKKEFDFVSRFFAPAAGIDEDPVTGSAHCCLAPYWQEKLGKSEMIGYQASARGGMVRVRIVGERVQLGGKAVLTVTGQLEV